MNVYDVLGQGCESLSEASVTLERMLLAPIRNYYENVELIDDLKYNCKKCLAAISVLEERDARNDRKAILDSFEELTDNAEEN